MIESRYERSRAQHERARRSLAGGVATAFRASQLPFPITFDEGRGASIRDIDGNEYIDYALAFGPMLLGHSPQSVIDAVTRQLTTGLGYGASHCLEAELAEAVCRTVPCAELCIFSSTGSEAVHVALRLARAATGRRRVIKFLGHYHGWLDPVFVGTPGLVGHAPATGGQDPVAAASTTICAWNDIDALRAVMSDDVAAVIMEPLAVNGGCLEPAPGYLEQVRSLTSEAGAVLIFDEVITGYRLGLGGAQERYGVVPDLAVLGKALGAGFPISAVCGRVAIMEEAASQRVAHVGTFNANPVCAAAAVAAITTLERAAAEIYPRLEERGAELAEGLRAAAAETGLPLVVNQVGGIAHAFVADAPVTTYEDTLRIDAAEYRRFAAALLGEGIHVIPRGILYVSTEHGAAELERTRVAARAAAETLMTSLATGERRAI